MIRCEDGTVKFKGTKKQLLIELMFILHSFMEKGIASRDELMENALISLMTNSELKQALIEAIDNMDDIGDALNLLGMLEHGLMI